MYLFYIIFFCKNLISIQTCELIDLCILKNQCQSLTEQANYNEKIVASTKNKKRTFDQSNPRTDITEKMSHFNNNEDEKSIKKAKIEHKIIDEIDLLCREKIVAEICYKKNSNSNNKEGGQSVYFNKGSKKGIIEKNFKATEKDKKIVENISKIYKTNFSQENKYPTNLSNCKTIDFSYNQKPKVPVKTKIEDAKQNCHKEFSRNTHIFNSESTKKDVNQKTELLNVLKINDFSGDNIVFDDLISKEMNLEKKIKKISNRPKKETIIPQECSINLENKGFDESLDLSSHLKDEDMGTSQQKIQSIKNLVLLSLSEKVFDIENKNFQSDVSKIAQDSFSQKIKHNKELNVNLMTISKSNIGNIYPNFNSVEIVELIDKKCIDTMDRECFSDNQTCSDEHEIDIQNETLQKKMIRDFDLSLLNCNDKVKTDNHYNLGNLNKKPTEESVLMDFDLSYLDCNNKLTLKNGILSNNTKKEDILYINSFNLALLDSNGDSVFEK
ncbi:hypothetical protein GVAV_002451 [Gurleya vavrai]